MNIYICIYVYCVYIYICVCVCLCVCIYLYNVYIYISGQSDSQHTECSNLIEARWVYIHHVPKSMSCHKAIAVITRRAYCFHD